MSNFKCSLDWLTFTYKPERSKHLGLKLDTLLLARNKLPIDLFFEEFPNIDSFVFTYGKKYDKGRFNYNQMWQVGSGNGSTDFIILGVHCTDTASVEYAFKQGVNVSIPGHYIPKFAELLGIDSNSPDFIKTMFVFLKNHGCQASRIDIAIDDFDKKYSAHWYCMNMINGYIVSNFHKYSFTASTRSEGCTFYLGDRKKRFLRIYDKWFESKGEVDSVRYEIESHENFAKSLFNNICEVGTNFNFVDFLFQFLKISELSPDYQEWLDFWLKDSLANSSTKLEMPKYNVYDQYIINAKFEESVYNYLASEAEVFGDSFILDKLHRARDNPTRRNKKLSSFYQSMDLNHSRGEFIRKQYSYGELLND